MKRDLPRVGEKGRGRAFIIGAGLSGLSAATILAERNIAVVLVESAPQAGGRCRSYFDPVLDTIIDNGNHLVLSGNKAVNAYLRRIGAREALSGPIRAEFDFLDLESAERWKFRPNERALPFWIIRENRRVPGTTAGDYLEYLSLLYAPEQARIGDIVNVKSQLWRKLMRPFFLAALNTAPEESSARLAGRLLRETLARGGRNYRPRIARPTLAAAFVDPALSYLKAKGASLRFGARLRAITIDRHDAIALDLPEGTIPVEPGDSVILAVPPWIAAELLPNLRVPNEFHAIVNAHFLVRAPQAAPAILGVVGGLAEWIFTFTDHISVTISNADAIVDGEREELAIRIWADVVKALNLGPSLPAWQIVKEKRATFAATPQQDARRPPSRTGWRNLFLAGDWTQTGLPATIEGALRSGEAAARLALRHLSI